MENQKNEDVSAYGNSIEMMKNKKTKKIETFLPELSESAIIDTDALKEYLHGSNKRNVEKFYPEYLQKGIKKILYQ